MSNSPSLRRVLTGYLRLRDPYNLAVDALIGLIASYVLGWAADWFYSQVQSPFAGEAVAPRAWRMGATVVGSFSAVLFYAAMGTFGVGLARIIADRTPPMHNP